MSRHAIEVDKVGKRYLLDERRDPYRTLRESLSSSLRRSRNGKRRELWALRDIDLTVAEGEVVGVIGRNGVGKTTLLKVIARITEPTTGVSRTRGRVGALLEVGTGFHPELTGRENVYLNGAVLGMSRATINRHFDEIVVFSELERFLDTPLKRYSSGMALRLAFSVAAHLEPEIVVVDEVLAVGDAEFRRKCLGKMSEFGRQGRTVVFVSHDLGAVNQLCTRAVWLDGGRVADEGPTQQVVDLYLGSNAGQAFRSDFEADPASAVQLLSVSVAGRDDKILAAPRRGEPLVVSLRFLLREAIHALDFAVSLSNRQGARVLDESWADTARAHHGATEPGEYDVSLTIPPVLAAGDYALGVWIGTAIGHLGETFVHEDVLSFQLWPDPDDRKEWTERQRIVHPSVVWEMRPRTPREH